MALEICFLYDAQCDLFRFRVLDRSLVHQSLLSRLAEQEGAELLGGQVMPNKKKRGKAHWFLPHSTFDIRTTFGDLKGRPLCFRSILRPFRRCLCLQARLGQNRAIENNWSGASDIWIDPAFREEGMSVAEKMAFFRARAGA